MKIFDMSETNHLWIKENLATISDGRGAHDIFKCEMCGIKGKSYSIGVIELDGRLKNPESCKMVIIPKKIKMKKKCTAMGKQFKNLTGGSVHKVIKPPKKQFPNGKGGVWVMGIGEPVRVLFGEYVEVE